jgi:uncharacterized protein YigE (DUF2233 family)
MVQFKKRLLLLGLSIATAACTVSPTRPLPSPTASLTPPIPTASPTATRVPSPSPTPEPDDTGWEPLAPGVSWRRLWAHTGAGRERLHLLRLEPDAFRLRVVYDPAHPRTVSQWATTLPEALIITNAGYFTPEYQAIGLVVSDGVSSGKSYADFAGMLAATPDGLISLRWLRATPYRSDEILAQAIQSFPVLVKPGGQMGFPADADEGQRSRRTIVAQDSAERILVIVAPEFRFSLHELAVWLAGSDLDLDIALNLDGGTSTGLWAQGYDRNIDSAIPVPAVLAFEAKDN